MALWPSSPIISCGSRKRSPGADTLKPAVLLLHTTEELTDRTILTCPPAVPPAALDRLLALPDVRTIDLHRYRCRVNLRPGTTAVAVGGAAEGSLLPAWGAPEPLPPQEEPRAFVIRRKGPRVVAESREMAGGEAVAVALFDVQGVPINPSKAIAAGSFPSLGTPNW